MRHLLIALAVLASAGCTATVDGTPRPAKDSAGIVGVGASLPQVLPDDATLSQLLGSKVSSRGFPPTVGALSELPDGIRDPDQTTELQCLGVEAPYMKKVYEGAPVRAVAFQSYDDLDSFQISGPSYWVDAGAIALPSPADAHALFRQFTDQWRGCAGKTMVMKDTAIQGEVHTEYEQITQVDSASDSVSAVVTGSEPDTHTDPNPVQRAIVVRSNCIVDVKVTNINWRAGDPVTSADALRVARMLADRIDTVG